MKETETRQRGVGTEKLRIREQKRMDEGKNERNTEVM
jgi:hypothetical protein